MAVNGSVGEKKSRESSYHKQSLEYRGTGQLKSVS